MATRAHTVPRFYLHGFVDPESETRPSPFVWLGSLATREVKPRAPKNISIARGLYDGAGGLHDANASIEALLSQIEAAAAPAIREFALTDPVVGGDPSPAIWRFLAWQAARTPGWLGLVQQWINEFDPDEKPELVEPPPDGIENIRDRPRNYLLRDTRSGEERLVDSAEELAALRRRGWQRILRRDEHLELMHMQVWYFQVRHFPRLSWTRLTAPEGSSFITSDRGVTWLADGVADTPPAALRHPTAQVVAPLTRRIALVGRHGTDPLQVTPREVNRFVAATASAWMAGSTRSVVEQAMQDRLALLSG